MTKKDDSEYTVGYRKPPRHTQFKPGRSGNPGGRPKKAKRFLEVLNKELLAVATLVEQSGKRQRVSMLEAILKHCVRNAAKGDLKATALVLNLLKLCQEDGENNLGVLVQQFRAINARYAADDAKTTDGDEPRWPTNSDGSGAPEAGS